MKTRLTLVYIGTIRILKKESDMKKSILLVLSFCILNFAILPASAAAERKTPETIYQTYKKIVQEANNTHDVVLTLAPLEEMNVNCMPTIKQFQNDVDAMVDAAKYFESQPGIQLSDKGIIYRIYHKLIANNGFVWGAGERTLSISTTSYAKEIGILWSLSPVIRVNTAPGTPNYYIGQVRDANMTLVTLPEGYQAKANSEFWYGRSYNLKTCTIYQQFILTKDYLSIHVVPHVSFFVDSKTGSIYVGEQETS